MPAEDVEDTLDFITAFPYKGSNFQLSVRAEWNKWKLQMKDWHENHKDRLQHLEKNETTMYDWWMSQSDTYGHLKEIALIVFAMPHSSTACERTFSSLSFIHNKLRNRLGNGSVKKLLKVFINMNGMDKKRKRDSEEEVNEELSGVDFVMEVEDN
jgi:hypothetical protein